MELATRYSTELRTNYGDVLQQLEDLRLAEWSDHAPPPPLAPGHNGQQSCSSTASTASIMTSMASNNPSSSDHLRTMGGQPPRQSYVNYPRGQDNEPIYVPGSYLVSQKSENLQYNTLACWLDETNNSDVPSITQNSLFLFCNIIKK